MIAAGVEDVPPACGRRRAGAGAGARATAAALAIACALGPSAAGAAGPRRDRERAEGPAADDVPWGPDGPGGYWEGDRRPEAAPPDGEWKILTGTILVPLGVLGVASSAGFAWATAPSRCSRVLASFELSASECQGLYVFNLVRVGYGAGFIVTGAVFLGVGLRERAEHDAWRRRRGRDVTRRGEVPRRGRARAWTLAPWAARAGDGWGAGVTWGWRL